MINYSFCLWYSHYKSDTITTITIVAIMIMKMVHEWWSHKWERSRSRFHERDLWCGGDDFWHWFVVLTTCKDSTLKSEWVCQEEIELKVNVYMYTLCMWSLRCIFGGKDTSLGWSNSLAWSAENHWRSSMLMW